MTRHTPEYSCILPAYSCIFPAYSCMFPHTLAYSCTYLSVGDMVHVGPLEGSLRRVPHQLGVMAGVDDQTINPTGVPQLCPS